MDANSKMYRAYRQNRLAKQIELYGYFDSGQLVEQDLGAIGSGWNTNDADVGITLNNTVYRCRKCRRILATSANIMEHDPLPRKKDSARAGNKFRSSRRDTVDDDSNDSEKCQIYIEAVTWMRNELEKGELGGKLHCVSCDARVGKYSWKGMQCSCSRWVVPAFMLQRSKVDIIAHAV